MFINSKLLPVYACLFSFLLSGCGGGSEDNAPEESVVIVEDDDEQPQSNDLIYTNPNDVSRFLTQTTFGPTLAEINALTNQSLSKWFNEQLAIEPSYLQPVLAEFSAIADSERELSAFELEATTIGFWRNAITGKDQLRQRMAFALSELLVVSNAGGETLTDEPSAVAYFQDLLIEHAFGNYRDVLEVVTYSPAMGYYLTYLGSEKGDPETGRMPDENYARELLQLFTIGVVELSNDGTPRLDDSGKMIETYSNKDVTGLARVFTGLSLNETVVEESVAKAYATPMAIFEESHSAKEKTFLNLTIAENTSAALSIEQALDHIFSHANLAPFVSSHLIQRLVSSNPSPEYIARVANAFEQGEFSLPNGDKVGDNQRGNLAATLAALLFDEEARNIQGETGGKVREPILRFSHWARAFNLEAVTPEFQQSLWDTTSSQSLSQHPYRSPSVFNFFRPGYIAPGTLTGAQNLKAPELQIVNASSIVGYSNFMSFYIFSENRIIDTTSVQDFINEEGVTLDASDATKSFLANYQAEMALIDDTDKLIEHLDLLLMFGTLSDTTRSHISSILNNLSVEEEDEKRYKIQLAVMLVMTSPDYLIQQ